MFNIAILSLPKSYITYLLPVKRACSVKASKSSHYIVERFYV